MKITNLEGKKEPMTEQETRRIYCPKNGHDITDLSGHEIFDHILLENGEIPN